MKKQFVQILITLLILLTVFFMIGPFKTFTEKRMEVLRNNLFETIQKQGNFDFRFKSISPAVIKGLSIRDFSIWDSLNTVRMDVEKVRMDYKLGSSEDNPLPWTLNKLLLAHGQITIKDPQEGANVESLDDILAMIKSLIGSGSIEFRDFNLDIDYQGAHVSVFLDRLILDHKKEGYVLRLKGRCIFEMTQEGTLNRVELGIRSKGIIDNDLRQLTMETTLNDIYSTWFDMEEQKLFIAINNENISIRKIKDNQPLDLEVSMDLSSNNFQLQWVSENFIPSQQLILKKNLALFNPWLSTGISGTAEIKYNLVDKSLFYDFDTRITLDNEILNEYIPEQTILTAVFTGDNERVTFNQLLAETSLADISYEGTLDFQERSPKGLLILKDYYLPNGLPLSMILELDYFEEIITMRTNQFYIGDNYMGVWDTLAQLMLENKEIQLSSQLSRSNNTLFLDGLLKYGPQWNLDVWYDIAHCDLGFYLENLLNLDMDPQLWEAYLADAQLDTQGEIEISEDTKNWNSEFIRIQNQSNNPYSVNFSHYWDGSFFTVDNLSLNLMDLDFEGMIQGEIQSDAMNFQVLLSQGDYSYDILGEWAYDQKLSLQGNYDLQAELRFLNPGNFLFNAKTANLPIDIGQDSLRLTLDLQGFWNNQDPEIQLNESFISWIHKDEIKVKVALSAMINSQIADIYRLEILDDYGTMEGSSRVHFGLSKPSFASGWLYLNSPDNEEVALNLSWQDDSKISGRLLTKNLKSQHILKSPDLSAVINSSIELSGDLEHPEIKGSIDSSLNFKETPGIFKTDFYFLNYDLEFNHMAFSFDSLEIQEGFFFSELDNGNTLLSLPLTYKMNDLPLTGSVTSQFILGYDALFKGIPPSIRGNVLLEPILFQNEELTPSMILNFDIENQEILLAHENPKILKGFYNIKSGDILLSSNQLLPISFDLNGKIKDNWMVSVNNIQSNLKWLNLFLPLDPLGRPFLDLKSAELQGNLLVRNNKNQLDFNGNIEINNILMDTLFSYKEIKPFDINIDFTDNRIQMEEFTAYVGEQGIISASADVSFEGYNLDEANFNGLLQETQRNGGVPVVLSIAGLNLDGQAVGDFEFHHDPLENRFDTNLKLNNLIISLGNLSAANMNQNEKIDFPLIFSANFVTGKDVRFVLPNEELTFVEAKAAEDQSLELYMDLQNQILTFKGDLWIEQGEIFYFNRSFYLSQGYMSFDETADSFNPSMILEAKLNTRDSQDKDVSILLSYEGSLIDEYDPVLSSDSSLSQAEILALLGQPIGMGADDAGTVIDSLVSATGSVVGQYSLILPVETALQNFFNLDKVSVDTKLIEKILLEQIRPEGLFTDGNNQYNLWEYLDGTRLDLGKSVTDKLYLNISAIVDTPVSQKGYQNKIPLELGFSFEMATPFFNLGWSYLQNQFDESNSDETFVRVSDMAITLEFHL